MRQKIWILLISLLFIFVLTLTWTNPSVVSDTAFSVSVPSDSETSFSSDSSSGSSKSGTVSSLEKSSPDVFLNDKIDFDDADVKMAMDRMEDTIERINLKTKNSLTNNRHSYDGFVDETKSPKRFSQGNSISEHTIIRNIRNNPRISYLDVIATSFEPAESESSNGLWDVVVDFYNA